MHKIVVNNVFSFTTHKRGLSDVDIEDRIAIDWEKRRYALSDGVTNSVLPEVWAQLLVDEYLKINQVEDFPTVSLSTNYQVARDLYAASLSKEKMYDLEIREEVFEVSSATFVGVEINESTFCCQIIGDSCLFVIPDEGDLCCISSLQPQYDDFGRVIVRFNNNPNQLYSNGMKKGEWVVKEESLKTGWILLMSDKMSMWFINQHNIGQNPLNKLLNIKDNYQFEEFVENEYQLGKLESDDETVVMIHLVHRNNSNASQTEDINTNNVACDTLASKNIQVDS